MQRWDRRTAAARTISRTMRNRELSADEAEFVGSLCHYVREHLDSFRDAGKRLDEHYSAAALQQRHDALVDGFRRVRASKFDTDLNRFVETDEPMYSEGFIEVTKAGHVPTLPGDRMGKAMDECASVQSDDLLDTARAELLCVLTWLAWDEHANSIKPRICEFQGMEWHFDPLYTDANRRQLHKDRVDSSWVTLARKSLSLARLRPSSENEGISMVRNAEAALTECGLPSADRWLRDRASLIAANISAIRKFVEKEEDDLRRRWMAERMSRVRRRRDELRSDLRHHPAHFPPAGRRSAYLRDQLRLEYRQPQDLSTAIFWATREAVERSKTLYSGRPFSRSFGAWVEFLLFVILSEDACNAVHVSEFQALRNEWPGRPRLLIDMKSNGVLGQLVELDARAWVAVASVVVVSDVAGLVVVGSGGSVEGVTLRADQLSSPERAVLIALERARRESPPRALDAGELLKFCGGLPSGQRHEFRDADHVRDTVYGLRKRKIQIPNPRNKSGYALERPLEVTVPDLAASIR